MELGFCVTIQQEVTVTDNRLFVCVNCYGADKNPLRDPRTSMYLSAVVQHCARQHDREIELHLLGGPTNRRDMSEAEAAKLWIDAYGEICNVVHIQLHEGTLDLRGNLEAVRQYTWQGAEVHYFCEYSRQPSVRALAKRILRGRRVTVIGVPYSKQDLSFRHRLVQLAKLGLEMAAYVIGWPFEPTRKYLRNRHIAQARRRAEKS